LNEYGIIEIQTKNFASLRKKLTYLLNEKKDVTIVYPILRNKKIIWLNSENERDFNRISPRHKDIFSAFKELYKIKPFLENPHLHLHFVYIDVIEFKNLNGYDLTRKKHASIHDCFPINIIDEEEYFNISDFWTLFEGVDASFTVKSLSKMKKANVNDVRIALNILNHYHVVQRIGKNGREFLYKKVR